MTNLFKNNIIKALFLLSSIMIGVRCQTDILNESVTEEESKELSLNHFLKSDNVSTAKRIEILTKGLVRLLQDQKARNFLFNEFLSSDKAESIIEASEILDKKNLKLKNNKLYRSFEEAMEEGLDKNEKAHFKKLMKELTYGEIDIYFPVEGHLNKWNASENLLICGIPPVTEENISDFIAFDLKGTEHILSVSNIPATPTLVIYKSEKNKNYNPNKLKEADNVIYAPTLPEDSPPDTHYKYKVGAYGICIAQHYDPWYAGKLEIYLKVKTKVDGGVWGGWVRIPEVGYNWIEIDPGHWRYHYQNYPTQEIQLFRTDKNFSIQIEIWEYDPNDPDDFVADAYYNQILECGNDRPTNIMRCDFTGCGDYLLRDGIYPGSDYDFLAIRFTRWQ